MSSTSIQNLLAQFLLFAVNILLLIGLHRGEAVSSSVKLVIRLISYENLANLRISGASCDSMSSPCDPAFNVIAVWGGEDIRVASPCRRVSNADRVYFPDELSRLPELAKPVKSRDGPMPRWAQVRISIRDCLFGTPTDLIADFELNVTTASVAVATEVAMETNRSLIGNRSIESSSEDQLAVIQAFVGESAAVLEMKRIRSTPESIRMKISVWIECSPGYYGKGCEIRCEPEGRSCCCDSEGRLRCDGTVDCSAQRAASTSRPATTPGAGSNNGGNADDHNKDEAASVMFIAVMASSMTSIFILAIIALVAIKMCRASESSALIISRLVSQDASSSIGTDSAVLHLRRQQNHYQLQQHQNPGYFNPSSYNTLTSQVTNMTSIVQVANSNSNNRTDSGVYEDPQEPPADQSEPPPPPPPPRQMQPRPSTSEEIQRMPQSKSYSRRAAKE